MQFFRPIFRPLVGFVLVAISVAFPVLAQQSARGSVSGRVTDELGGLVAGATVRLIDRSGKETRAISNNDGAFHIPDLVLGDYTLRVEADGFAAYEMIAVMISSRQSQPLNIVLSIKIKEEQVTVDAGNGLDTAADRNRSAIILSNDDLDVLPDDPDLLAQALQALAGPSAGPEGAQIFVDGFSGGQVPSKASIREVRLNQNPFSAEYDRLGYGRIEILTKPGSDQIRGQVGFNFSDAKLNSRNPFSLNRAPYRERRFDVSLSGPIDKKSSFFIDFGRRETNDNAIVNAIVLDNNLAIVPFRQTLATPQRRTSLSPRFDFQVGANHTLVARYTFTRSSGKNDGIGELSLPTRAFSRSSEQHVLSLTETALLGPTLLNEIRFQYLREHRAQKGNNSFPTIIVRDAFVGGGPQTVLALGIDNRWELQNYTSWTVGHHVFRGGARLRRVQLQDFSSDNFGGTFIFDSLQQYKDVVSNIAGSHPAQFTQSGGDPEARVSQTDLGVFVQDEWLMRRNVTVSLGLRYELQNHINSHLNYAPRVALAWAPRASASKEPKTVVRAGFGIFYDRFSENLILQTRRFNGINQQQIIRANPDFFSAAVLPPLPVLLATQSPDRITKRVADDLQSPYVIQSVLSLERQLPLELTLTTTFINSRALHVLRTRNVNSFLPGSFNLEIPGSGIRPLANLGNIFEYESTGILKQNQLVINVNKRLSKSNKNLTLFATYILGKADSDTDGVGSFPVNSYDLRGEFGRSSLDIRHRFLLGGTINAPFGLRLNPFVVAFSGRPFNITSGVDANGDTQFVERPAFLGNISPPAAGTRLGVNFDPNPGTGRPLIPRNFGNGPAFVVANLRVSKSLVLNHLWGGHAKSNGGLFGKPRPAPGVSERNYNMTFALQVQNIFNQTNAGQPIGNIRSPLFGQSISNAGSFGLGFGSSTAGNRRLEAQVRLTF